MTENLILMFAYHFPPENEAGAARPFRFAKYLSRLGYNCRVYTAAEPGESNGPKAEYIPDPFASNSRHGLRWQLERGVRKLLLPGELGTQWSHYASRAARAYIREHPGARATIFSTSPPLGPHLAAWQLARDQNLRWIADFRDPFTDELKEKRMTRLQNRVRNRLERMFLRRADAVIENTDAAALALQTRFPFLGGRVHSIWNGFDPEDRVPALPIPVRNYKVLSHVGDLYSGRNVTAILESIARLISAGQLSPSRVRVRLIGPVDRDSSPDPVLTERAKHDGWLEIVSERIPLSDARQVIQTSDGLLLLQPQSAVSVPGKLFEYLQIGRPILAVIQPNSPSEYLLRQSGARYECVYPGSAQQETDAVVARFFSLPSTPVAPNSWFEERFNAENQTRRLDALIRHLHGETHLPDASYPLQATDVRGPSSCNCVSNDPRLIA